eukprot:6184335-Pleurochrysis_carterae.AAC.1
MVRERVHAEVTEAALARMEIRSNQRTGGGRGVASNAVSASARLRSAASTQQSWLRQLQLRATVFHECVEVYTAMITLAIVNRRGGAVDPRTIMRLKVLRQCVGRGKP